MFQITIFFLYLVAAVAFGLSRLARDAARARIASLAAFFATGVAVVIHCRLLYGSFVTAADISLTNVVSLIGLQLGLTALIGAFDARLRGLGAGLLLLAALAGVVTVQTGIPADASPMSWQIRTHVLTSIFAYGLLTVGAFIAVYAIVQESRLQRAQLTSASALFAPLETTERLLFAIATTGFIVLALSVITGVTFIENLFAQHLVHKTTLSLLALLLFAVLLIGRWFAGWRGTRAIALYLAGFASLCLAYFGSRFVLEQLLGRSWG